MKKIVTLIIALVISAVAFAQEDNYDKLVEKCIKSNGTYAYYENVVDQMFTMLEKQYASQEVPVTVWNELKRLKEPSLDDLGQMIVSAYRTHFTNQDVKNMNRLYATQAGQKMFKSEYDLTEGDKEVLTEFYRSETGQKITGSQDSMNTAMSEISEMWRSNFYQAVVEKLSKKGFNL